MYKTEHKITINSLRKSVLHRRPPAVYSLYVMLCKGVPLCAQEGADQCNINVSISTKLSSSSRENSPAAPVSMTLSDVVPALNSPSSLSDNIYQI